jgi:5-methylcytosine-specific restriction endonuclease McrBC GTP-binding regulatory subunit McrB
MEIKYKDGTFIVDQKDTHLYDFFEGKGFFFSKEILSRYFLSLRAKPFVILTGISGTGKTKIAQIFADYMCQDDEREDAERRKAFIPVRPDWMDDKGLLGFYNILDQKYHSTPLLDLLLNAMENPEKPHFVILDEMNLAKVEQYFSDFLSIMESRTSDRPEGEHITLHAGKDVKAEDGRTIPQKIHIPSNVLFTGTVNVDETTYMFSPKVLDRANVIEFNEVDLDGYSSGVSNHDSFYLENPDVRNALLDPEIPPFCSRQDYARFKDVVGGDANPFQELLSRLKEYNMHFGYRVVNEMSRFVWMAREGCGEHFDLDDAIDIQLLQKVLPKFHGTQGKLEKPLADLLCFCFGKDYGGEKPSEELVQKAREVDNEALYPRSARKIARMIENLRTLGYTSFIE